MTLAKLNKPSTPHLAGLRSSLKFAGFFVFGYAISNAAAIVAALSAHLNLSATDTLLLTGFVGSASKYVWERHAAFGTLGLNAPQGGTQ